MATVKITNVFEALSPDPKTPDETAVFVNYIVDSDDPDIGRRGPMLEIFRKRGFNLETAKRRITEREADYARIIGQTFDV